MSDVKWCHKLTQQKQSQSIACDADRRSDPAPLHTHQRLEGHPGQVRVARGTSCRACSCLFCSKVARPKRFELLIPRFAHVRFVAVFGSPVFQADHLTAAGLNVRIQPSTRDHPIDWSLTPPNAAGDALAGA
jgi:hypothetical protein